MKQFSCLFAILALVFTAACEDKVVEPDKSSTPTATADASKTGQEPGTAAENGSHEAKLLAALDEVGNLLNANMGNADTALEAVKAYLDKHEAQLKESAAFVRKKAENMEPEAADVYQKKNSNSPEMMKYTTMTDRFEQRYPDRYGDFEQLLNPIQSAGAGEDTIVEAPESGGGDPKIIFEAAEKSFKELEGIEFTSLNDAEVRAKLSEIAGRADEVEKSYQRVFQLSQDPAFAVGALVRAGDLYVLLAQKIVTIKPPADVKDPAEFGKARVSATQPMRAKAGLLYEAALKRAEENTISNEQTKHAEAALEMIKKGPVAPTPAPKAPTDGGTAPEGVPPTDGGTAPEGVPPTDGGTAPPEAPKKKDAPAPTSP